MGIYSFGRNTPFRVGCSNYPIMVELVKALDAPCSGTLDKRFSVHPKLVYAKYKTMSNKKADTNASALIKLKKLIRHLQPF